MGSEQSQLGHDPRKRQSAQSAKRLMRGNTVAVSERRLSSPNAEQPGTSSRPVSPPISVCSDSDLPYVSYTDKPIGGDFKSTFAWPWDVWPIRDLCINVLLILAHISDSPKHRNKATLANTGRSNRSTYQRTMLPKAKSVAHDIVVVREANKKGPVAIDPDLQRLQVGNYLLGTNRYLVRKITSFPLLRLFSNVSRVFHNSCRWWEEQFQHPSTVIQVLQSVCMRITWRICAIAWRNTWTRQQLKCPIIKPF